MPADLHPFQHPDPVQAPERIWAKGDRGFEGYAGTWLDESDGPDMTQYIRLDLHEAAIASARAQALEEAANEAQGRCAKCGAAGWLWGHELNDYEPPHPGSHDDTRYSCDGDGCKTATAIRALSATPDTASAVIEAAKAVDAAVAEYFLHDNLAGACEAAVRKAAVRGLMVRMGLYEQFNAALAEYDAEIHEARHG